jgi:hypothetical protein
MPDNDSSTKVTAVMSKSLKEQLKGYAELKRWTMSQAIVYLVEEGLKNTAEESVQKK